MKERRKEGNSDYDTIAGLYIVHDFETKFAGNFFEFHNLPGILSIFY